MEKKLKWPDDFLNIKCVIYTIYISGIYILLYYIGYYLENLFSYFSLH